MTDVAVHVLEPNRRLDAIDRMILTVLQDDASLSVAEIGDRVGLSSTPCWKRIQRLEADGVILRRVALVDQNKIGLGISVFVSVESSDHSEAWLRKFAGAGGVNISALSRNGPHQLRPFCVVRPSTIH